MTNANKNFTNIINTIITSDFAKAHLTELYCSPIAINADTTWIDLFYKLNETMPSAKECVQFENYITDIFCDAPIGCSLCHIDFADDLTKESAPIWTNND